MTMIVTMMMISPLVPMIPTSSSRYYDMIWYDMRRYAFLLYDMYIDNVTFRMILLYIIR